MKKAFLITWVTHNSRTSWRMIEYRVKKDDGYWMDNISEKIVTESILDVVQTDDLNVLAYNICGDHVHMVMVCEEDKLNSIIQKLKAVSFRKHNVKLGISKSQTRENAPLLQESSSRGCKQNSLWAQKFHAKEISDENALSNAVEYVRYNRVKHALPPNYETHKSIKQMICEYDESLFI